jgi:hypothetical protein
MRQGGRLYFAPQIGPTYSARERVLRRRSVAGPRRLRCAATGMRRMAARSAPDQDRSDLPPTLRISWPAPAQQHCSKLPEPLCACLVTMALAVRVCFVIGIAHNPFLPELCTTLRVDVRRLPPRSWPAFAHRSSPQAPRPLLHLRPASVRVLAKQRYSVVCGKQCRSSVRIVRCNGRMGPPVVAMMSTCRCAIAR